MSIFYSLFEAHKGLGSLKKKKKKMKLVAAREALLPGDSGVRQVTCPV